MKSRSRVLLIGSLTGLLLTAVTGVAGLVVFGRIQTGESALRTRHLERSGALERLRNSITLSGTLARDYFADPHADDAPSLLARLRDLRDQSTSSLRIYLASGPAASVAANLQGDVTAYWKVLDLMTEMALRRRSDPVQAYFRGQLAQRRETMLQIAGEIGSALDSERKDREAELSRMYAQSRRLFVSEILLVIFAGGVVSILTILRISKLEHETRALSGRLVDAQEQERRSIARELHDEVGQSLSALLLDVGTTASLSEHGPIRDRLDRITVAADRIVEEVRRIALSLRPSMLDDLGLIPALDWQAREVGKRTGMVVELAAEESAGEVPDAQRTCIYRIAQESLQNSARHSGATRVRIGLRKNARAVSLEVQDNGSGFATARTRGLGLLGIEERVSQLGGELHVLSEPGQGTRILAELPL